MSNDGEPLTAVLSERAGASPARRSSASWETTLMVAGAERILETRCGRSVVASPFCASVPYSFVSRAALPTFWSISSVLVVNCALTAARHRLRRASESASFGRSMRASMCAPFPESATTLSGKPSLCSQASMALASSIVAVCSPSVDETPSGHFGSTSTSSHRLATISASAVRFFAYGTIRLLPRPRRSGTTGFKVM
jgi:hypothetical protein